jgi:hypothetical protein
MIMPEAPRMKNILVVLATTLFMMSGQVFGQAILNANTVKKNGTTGANLAGDDEKSGNIPIGFNFTFFGQSKSHFSVNTNGVLFFGTPNTEYRSGVGLANDSLAVMLDDWQSNPSRNADELIFYKVEGAAPNRKLFVQWNNYGIYNSNLPFGTMQAILYETTNVIQFQYISLLTPGRSDAKTADVAIRGANGTQVTHLNTGFPGSSRPEQGTSVCWVPSGGSYTKSVINAPNANCTVGPTQILTNQTSPPPDKPVGLSRAGSVFSWNAAANADTYNLRIATNDKLNNMLVNQTGINATSYDTGLTFRQGTTYYWVVRAVNSQGTTTSDLQQFRIPLTAPTAVDDSYSVSQDGILQGRSRDVLANDHDPKNVTLWAVLVTPPAHADSFVLNADGTFDYDPENTFAGVDSFTYKANDLSEDSGIATVRIAVTDANFAPTAQDDAYSVAEDGTLTVNAPGVLGNDGDIDVHDQPTALKVTDPANGSLTVNADGGLTYTPNADFNGSDSATYKANDGHLDSPAATIRFTVNAVNDAPVSSVDSYSVPEDGHLDVLAGNGVLANDHDAEGDHLSAVLDSGPSSGTLTLNADGSFNYVPIPLFFGSDSFSYHANDGSLDGAVIAVNITVNHVNHPPVGNPDGYSLEEDGVLNVVVAKGVLANDTDRDKQDHLNARKLTTAGNGLLHLNADGSFDYRPSPNYNGPDSFTYEVWDGIAASHPVAVNITVRPVNDPVSVHEDVYHVPEDGFLNIDAPALGILANDIDPDGDTLTALLHNGAFNGQLHLRKDGTFTYRPNPDFNGTDAFIYKVYDGNASQILSSLAQVSIYVKGVNDAPLARDDSYSVFEDGILAVHASESLLRNDFDIDGDTLNVVNLTAAANGSVTLGTGGQFIYRPNANFNGLDSFTYQVTDGSLTSNTATVVVNVRAKNDDPIAVDDAYSVGEDGLLTVTQANGTLANDKDVDADTLVMIIDSAPVNGTLQADLNGSFTYRPDANFNGSDSFTYFVSDATANSAAPATVTLTVNAVNDPPLAGSNGYAVAEDGFLRVPVNQGILGNDIDPDGDSLLALLDAGTTHGALQFSLDGSFTYKPDAGFNGVDGFTYHANDGNLDSPTVSVGIAVNPVNDKPLAGSDSYSVSEDAVLDIAESAGLLNNDIDLDGDTLSVVLKSTTTHGHLIVTPGGAVNYRPDADFNGSDSFTYTAFDGSVESDPVTVTITVNPVNDPPLAGSDAYTIAEDGVLNVTAAAGVLANDIDFDGDLLNALGKSLPAHGALHLNQDGSFTYQPDPAYNGEDQFSYAASDGALESSVVSVKITVSPVNDPPTGVGDSYSVPQDALLGVTAANGVLANDSDIDGNSLLALIVSYPASGALGLNLDGSFVYTPASGFSGGDSFTYRPNDGSVSGSLVVVNITVNAVNTPPLAGSDSYSTFRDGNLDVSAAKGVLANDIDPDGDQLTALLQTSTTHGSLHFNLDGSFSYWPDTGYVGLDSFSYLATDSGGNSVSALAADSGKSGFRPLESAAEANSSAVTVTLDVRETNEPPHAVNDSYSVDQGEALSVAAPGVLGNDSDPDGDQLTATLVVPPLNGTVHLNLDGSFTFTAPPNFSGSVSFRYEVNDGHGETDQAEVDIEVIGEVITRPIPGLNHWMKLLLVLIIAGFAVMSFRRMRFLH